MSSVSPTTRASARVPAQRADESTPHAQPVRSSLSPADVDAALVEGRLQPHFQPIVGLPSRHVVGFEALARIVDRDGSLVPPARFIPGIEGTPQIVRLGTRMLTMAVRAAAAWRHAGTSLASASISVNVAPAQLDVDGFADFVPGLIRQYGLPASALVLEITESTATSEQARPVLDQLSASGIRLALDDFGIGFSNLDQLRRLPIHILKLDQSYVAGIDRRGTDQSIVRTVITLANDLGLAVIGEGIETNDQAAALLQLGCRTAQGFLFARPNTSPQAAAEAVVPTHERLGPVEAQDPDRATWSAAIDCGVLAAARLLTKPQDRHRGALYALAGELARHAGWPAPNRHTASRLALVHDVTRLLVDGRLPDVLADVDVVSALLTTAGARHVVADPDCEISLVNLARDVVDAAAIIDPDVGPEALRTALRDAAARTDQQPAMVTALLACALEPPTIDTAHHILDDLDARRLGRRAMAERLSQSLGLSRLLAGAQDADQLLVAALEEARRIMGAAAVSLEQWERESGTLRVLANVGELGPGEQRFPTDETYPMTEAGTTAPALTSGLVAITTLADAEAYPFEVALLRQFHKGSSAAVPLFLEDRVWGQLWFATGIADAPFGARDVDLLATVATLMSGVLAQTENLDRRARDLYADPLTGLANRRSVDDHLARLRAQGDAVSVVAVDIDGLRLVNETYGTAHGDDVVCQVADLLSSSVSAVPHAIVGRLGSDHYCAVLPGVGPDAAVRLMRAAAHEARRRLGVGFRVGVAHVDGPWGGRDVLIEAAVAMNAAKASGPFAQR